MFEDWAFTSSLTDSQQETGVDDVQLSCGSTHDLSVCLDQGLNLGHNPYNIKYRNTYSSP